MADLFGLNEEDEEEEDEELPVGTDSTASWQPSDWA